MRDSIIADLLCLLFAAMIVVPAIMLPVFAKYLPRPAEVHQVRR